MPLADFAGATTHVTLEFPVPVSEILEWFTVFNDNGGDGLPTDDAKRLARSALVHLFAPAPDEQLLAYLRTPPAGSPPQKADKQSADSKAALDEAQVERPDSPSTIPHSSPLLSRLPTMLSAAAFGQADVLQDAAADLPFTTRTFIDGLLSARAGDSESLSSAIDALEADAHERSLLEGLRSRAQAENRASPSDATGIRVATPKWFDGERPNDLKLIGVATKELDAVVFVKPLAICVNDVWMRLSDSDRANLFPISGDTMTHRGSGKRIPQVGEYVHWLVEHRDRDLGRTRFHLVEELSRLHEIVELASSSGEPDEVRAEILRWSERRRSPQQVLFALRDGLILSPRSSDLSRSDAYEQPWFAWKGVAAIALDGRMFALDRPRGESLSIDLSPLELVIKRLVKSFIDDRKLTLTKKQLSELAEIIRSEDVGLNHSRAARVLRHLDSVALDRDAIEALLPNFEARPEFQSRVNDLVDREVRRRIEERDGLVAEIETAQAKKRQLQESIKALERQSQLLESETEKAVTRTFQKAIDKGLETLAEVAIFKELSGRKGWSGETTVRTTSDSRRNLSVKTIRQSLDEDSALRELSNLGVLQSTRLTSLVAARAARATGLALVIRGPRSRHVAQILARIGEGDAITVDVPLGFKEVAEFSSMLDGMSGASSVCLLNADAAPIELYAGALFDLIASRMSREFDQRLSPTVFIALSAEEMLPMKAGDLGVLGLHLDLSSVETPRGGLELEDAELPWPRVAKRRMDDFLSELPADEKEAVNALFHAGDRSE